MFDIYTIIYPGSNALTISKQKELLVQLNKSHHFKDIHAYYIHIVHSTVGHIDSSLQQLLSYGKPLTHLESQQLSIILNSNDETSNNQSIVISIPRSGTISPWSSKATDIAHQTCSKDTVIRIERAILYILDNTGIEIP